jgi:Short repeat of unknown function (DUF308)
LCQRDFTEIYSSAAAVAGTSARSGSAYGCFDFVCSSRYAGFVSSSLAGIAVGVLCFFWTGMSALALLYVIGAYAIALGVIGIWGAFAGPLDGGDSVLLGLSGVVSILFGVVMFAKPGAGALVLLALIAAYALVIGIAELVAAIGGQRLLNAELKRVSTPAKPSRRASPDGARGPVSILRAPSPALS